MKTKKNLLAAVAILLCCGALVWCSASTHGHKKTYEIRPQVGVPEYRTDAARAIDAYERLMERYMDLTEGNLITVSMDIRDVVRKLDEIDGKVTQISARMARIEKALRLRPAAQRVKKRVPPEEVQEEPQQKPVPPE
ncbi:MAG: hypothetical protein ACYSUC_09460 [Planctomycetota bacterium]|jgi:hypothetical protein